MFFIGINLTRCINGHKVVLLKAKHLFSAILLSNNLGFDKL